MNMTDFERYNRARRVAKIISYKMKELNRYWKTCDYDTGYKRWKINPDVGKYCKELEEKTEFEFKCNCILFELRLDMLHINITNA